MDMDFINFACVPEELRCLNQWVLWINSERDGKSTKVPVQLGGHGAKSNDPKTWTTFASVKEGCMDGGIAGIGFMFSKDDPYCGIDLDGCRDPKTGAVAEWAREIVLKFSSYSEVSPSKTGIKIFCRGQSPFSGGKKLNLPEKYKTTTKNPAIEIYDSLRYFAVTGWRLKSNTECADAADALEWLRERWFLDEPVRPKDDVPTFDWKSDHAVIERARKYLAKLPPAISGQGGHPATFHAACCMVCGFGLTEDQAMMLMREYNASCSPQWSEKELLHKVRSAAQQPGPKGDLRDAAPKNYGRIKERQYIEPAAKPEPRQTTLVDATKKYLESIKNGETGLVDMTIPELDYALSGGCQFGEMVIFAARPSMGKSACALQCVHQWTNMGYPCAIVSEEMSALMLGRRSLQFLSALPEEHWTAKIDELGEEVDLYAKTRKTCIVLENCGTAEAACEGVKRAVRDHGVKCAVVDYAQLLRGQGKDLYTQITNTSLMLRGLTSNEKILLLVLCQLSRGVESRKGDFEPVMSDIRGSGQLEQDADVITFLHWPYKLDQTKPMNLYSFYVVKNRNRAIRQSQVNCRFLPDRQKIMDSAPERTESQTTWRDFQN
jgi:replicative DNA helicase